ncbi:MAG: signal recognition particle protein [Bacteroidota bacterium]
MFESLSQGIESAIKSLKGQGRISAINIATTVKEIRRALVKADVHYKVAKQVTDAVKEKALGMNVLTAVSPGQLFTKVVNEELTALMGGTKADLRLAGNPAIILMTGLQGSGKTTFSSKLAAHFKKNNKRVLLVACDVYRPAAIEQLKVLGEQIGVEVYAEPDNKDTLQIAKNGIQHAKTHKNHIAIVDTAGRLAVDNAMMQEIAALKQMLQPSETLFVVDAMTGQDAVNTAKAFNEQVDFDGVVLTKLDGDTRGGAALSIRTVVDKPIKFIGIGEKMDDLDVFYPERMAGRILGMGDIVSLVERAEQVYSEEQARKINKKLRQNQFNFEDFITQLKQFKKMGNIKDLVGMIPSMSKLAQAGEVKEDAFRPFEIMISSMTPYERTHPDAITKSRRTRIAQGSGLSLSEIDNLIKKFEGMRKMMQKVSKGGVKQIAQVLGL